MEEIGTDTKIALVGAGAMGSAILKGWLNADTGSAAALSAENFWVVEPTCEKAQALKESLGVHTLECVEDLTGQNFDIVLLAVKPQVLPTVLKQLAETSVFCGNLPLVVSIAAGITTDVISDILKKTGGCLEEAALPVVRVMPNLPLQVGRGASVVAGGNYAAPADAELVKNLFSALGFAEIVDESQIDAVCAISGGGPAYVAYMIEALTDAGVQAGIPADLAEKLAVSTFEGTCTQIMETGVDPADLRRAVCSPGGTTLAALAAMDDGGFSESIKAGIRSAIDRAKELSAC